MSKLSKANFATKWDPLFADNTSGNITEEMLRDFVADVKDSFACVESPILAPGSSVTFTEAFQQLGTSAAPETNNIAGDTTNAVAGSRALLVHQNLGGAPTFDGKFKATVDSQAYNTAKLNFIECWYLAPGLILYRITQEA